MASGHFMNGPLLILKMFILAFASISNPMNTGAYVKIHIIIVIIIVVIIIIMILIIIIQVLIIVVVILVVIVAVVLIAIVVVIVVAHSLSFRFIHLCCPLRSVFIISNRKTSI